MIHSIKRNAGRLCLVLAAAGLITACGLEGENQSSAQEAENMDGIAMKELEYIPEGYERPAKQQGTLEKLTYHTWESFTYEEHTQQLEKEAWVYVPCNYNKDEKYNIMYLSHGGWSNETTIMGTDKNPGPFKNVIDHAIEDGKIKPLLIVLPTYNNTSENDSGDYSLALQLTDQFHNELMNDLVPAAEEKYSTYAEDTTLEGLAASGTSDFAYSAFKAQIQAMGNAGDGTFRLADNEKEGNLLFLEREGYSHDMTASNEYTYNGLRFFWNGL